MRTQTLLNKHLAREPPALRNRKKLTLAQLQTRRPQHLDVKPARPRDPILYLSDRRHQVIDELSIRTRPLQQTRARVRTVDDGELLELGQADTARLQSPHHGTIVPCSERLRIVDRHVGHRGFTSLPAILPADNSAPFCARHGRPPADPLVDLLTVHRDVRRRIDADPHLAAAHAKDPHRHMMADLHRLADLPSQHQHGDPLWTLQGRDRNSVEGGKLMNALGLSSRGMPVRFSLPGFTVTPGFSDVRVIRLRILTLPARGRRLIQAILADSISENEPRKHPGKTA